MSVQEVTPSIDPKQLLAGAQFIDAYRIAVEGSALNARTAAIKMFARAPRWIEALLNLRNLIVVPLGLKTSGDGEPASGGLIGLFPVLSETPERWSRASTISIWIFAWWWMSHRQAATSRSRRPHWC